MPRKESEDLLPVTNENVNKDVHKSIGSLKGIGATTGSEVRMNLVRWLNLAHALTVGDLYEKQPNEFTSLEDLVEFGLLASKEYEYLKSVS